ncbi:MAG: GTPase HflX, partial [Candidatus Brockarchaeota archaeon]|nr:GTPase HflX [Candidatus Brockarchaeota archaeon]
DRAYICYLKTNPHDHSLFKIRLLELENLAKVIGYEVVDKIVQVNTKPDPKYLFGSGKINEIKNRTKKEDVDIIIFYNELSAKQQFNLKRILGKEVIDRYDLTLKIFDLEASDETSKLQIKLAKLIKEIPYQKLLASIKYKAGREHPGPRSLGEYSYHKVVSMLLKNRAKLEEEINHKLKMHKISVQKRKSEAIPLVCITGYYNAGKTSIFNTITNLDKPVSERPFTTLSSKYYLVEREDLKFYLVDTIGFVIDLDPRLIYSFKLTLEDISSSDLILLVVDISDQYEILELRTRISLKYLNNLNISKNDIILVFNKIDKVSLNEAEVKINKLLSKIGEYNYVLASAKNRNIKNLIEKIGEKIKPFEEIKEF